MNLSQALTDCGCKTELAEFRDLVQELFAVNFPTQTVSWLLRHPEKHGLPFVEQVRRKAHCKALPDWVVLGVLENLRQKGNLSLKDRAGAEA